MKRFLKNLEEKVKIVWYFPMQDGKCWQKQWKVSDLSIERWF